MRSRVIGLALLAVIRADVAFADDKAPPPPTPAAVAPAEPPPPPAAPPPLAEEPPREKPLRKKPLFWIAVFGGLAVIATGVGLGIALGLQPRDPIPTLGVGVGN